MCNTKNIYIKQWDSVGCAFFLTKRGYTYVLPQGRAKEGEKCCYSLVAIPMKRESFPTNLTYPTFFSVDFKVWVREVSRGGEVMSLDCI